MNGQSLRDTVNLLARRPWYSYSYNDVIEGLSLNTWNKMEKGRFSVADKEKKKQYR